MRNFAYLVLMLMAIVGCVFGGWIFATQGGDAPGVALVFVILPSACILIATCGHAIGNNP